MSFGSGWTALSCIDPNNKNTIITIIIIIIIITIIIIIIIITIIISIIVINITIIITIIIIISKLIKIKSVAYNSQGDHTGKLDFCN